VKLNFRIKTWYCWACVLLLLIGCVVVWCFKITVYSAWWMSMWSLAMSIVQLYLLHCAFFCLNKSFVVNYCYYIPECCFHWASNMLYLTVICARLPFTAAVEHVRHVSIFSLCILEKRGLLLPLRSTCLTPLTMRDYNVDEN
jgi:hypothetical protein